MRAEDVPGGWMEAADRVLVPGKPMTTSDLRKALAAVAPLIVAQERERCARVAEGTPYHGRYRTWPWWANPDGSQGNRENESDVVRHADAIAAAIRALGDEKGNA